MITKLAVFELLKVNGALCCWNKTDLSGLVSQNMPVLDVEVESEFGVVDFCSLLQLMAKLLLITNSAVKIFASE